MKKIYISSFIGLCLIFGLMILNLNGKIEQKNNLEVYDNLLKVLQYYLNDEEQLSLSIAISLSKNDSLKQALIDEDEEKGFAILKDNTTYLNQFMQSKNLYTQVLTKDLFILARSWDSVYGGMPLEDYREDLKDVINTNQPKVEIELGTHLNLKATAPIESSDEVLGVLEVVVMLDTIVTKMREVNIELLPIMDNQFLDKAYLMEQNEVVQNGFVVAIKNYNKQSLKLLNSLSKNEFNELLKNNFVIKDGYFISSYEMTNKHDKEFGKFLIIINLSEKEKFMAHKTSVFRNIMTMGTSKEDIYNITKQQNKDVFLNIEDGYIANFKDIVDKNDINEFEEVATKKLSKLSKDELINFILQKPKQAEIRGEIK